MELADQEAVVDETDACQKECQDRKFEDNPEGEEEVGRKRKIFPDPDGRPDIDRLIASEKKTVAYLKDHFVAEPSSEKKE